MEQSVSARKKAAAKPAPGNPQIAEFVRWFAAEYQRRRGADYLVQWGRDMAIVKRLLHATSYERLQKLAQILLTADVDRWINESDRGISILSVKFNWLSDRLAQWEKRRQS